MDSDRFNCPFEGCWRSYSIKKTLQRHIAALHNETKRFVCDVCDKVLSSRQNLNEHVSIHTGESIYKCIEPGCGLSFRQGSQLSTHKKIHQAVSLFKQSKEVPELKVIHRQLTSLISSQSTLPVQPYELETPQWSAQELILPPITNQTHFQPLPPINNS